MKKVRFIIVFAIMVITVGIAQKVYSQEFFVQIYQLDNPAAQKADGLKSFYQEGSIIERYDAAKMIVFKMKCCSDSTFLIYFPIYDKVTGERKNCDCPRLTLYKRQDGWFTDNMPADGEKYCKEETNRQISAIEEAIGFLEKN